MEPVKVPLDQILEALKQDTHHCDKELFAFISYVLKYNGMYALTTDVGDDEVYFTVERD